MALVLEPQHEIRYSVTDVTVPEAAKPGSLLAVRFQQNHTLNIDGDWVFYVVPEKCVAGSCFEARFPYYVGLGWPQPEVIEYARHPHSTRTAHAAAAAAIVSRPRPLSLAARHSALRETRAAALSAACTARLQTAAAAPHTPVHRTRAFSPSFADARPAPLLRASLADAVSFRRRRPSTTTSSFAALWGHPRRQTPLSPTIRSSSSARRRRATPTRSTPASRCAGMSGTSSRRTACRSRWHSRRRRRDALTRSSS